VGVLHSGWRGRTSRLPRGAFPDRVQTPYLCCAVCRVGVLGGRSHRRSVERCLERLGKGSTTGVDHELAEPSVADDLCRSRRVCLCGRGHRHRLGDADALAGFGHRSVGCRFGGDVGAWRTGRPAVGAVAVRRLGHLRVAVGRARRPCGQCARRIGGRPGRRRGSPGDVGSRCRGSSRRPQVRRRGQKRVGPPRPVGRC
jgi:hypothetical protein